MAGHCSSTCTTVSRLARFLWLFADHFQIRIQNGAVNRGSQLSRHSSFLSCPCSVYPLVLLVLNWAGILHSCLVLAMCIHLVLLVRQQDWHTAYKMSHTSNLQWFSERPSDTWPSRKNRTVKQTERVLAVVMVMVAVLGGRGCGRDRSRNSSGSDHL